MVNKEIRNLSLFFLFAIFIFSLLNCKMPWDLSEDTTSVKTDKTYNMKRTFCINSIFGNAPDCSSVDVVITVSNGHVTSQDGLTGTVDSDGKFEGTFSSQGSTWTVTGNITTKLQKQPVYATNQSGVNITWTPATTTTGNTLTPARSLVGTWKTPSAVTFYYLSDYCGSSLQRVAKFDMKMTWKITQSSNAENEVNIEWSSDSMTTAQSIINPPCNYYIPIVTPKFLKGIISSSQVDLYEGSSNIKVGSMSLTADNLAGNYSYSKCELYCYGYETDSKKLILMKQ